MSRLRIQDSAALALGSAVTGLLSYAVFALTTRALGAEQAAPVSVLWSYWTFASAALTFPLQHWVTRAIAGDQEGAVIHGARTVLAACLAAAAVVGVVAWVLREPLFGRSQPWFPVLCAGLTLAAALVGVSRGALAGRRRFFSLAWSLVGENTLRCIATATLMVLGVRSAVAYGLSLLGGYLVVLLRPDSLRFRGQRRSSGVAPLRFLGAAAGGQLIATTVLTGGPVLLALAGGSPAQVTALFAALALFRAPYLIALGGVSQLTGRFTVLFSAGELAALRRAGLLLLAGTVVTTTLAAAVGAWLGPLMLPFVFGPEVVLPARATAVIASGSALAVSNLVATVALMAQNRTHAVARAWLLAVVCGGLLFVLADLAPAPRTVAVFATAELVAFIVLLVEHFFGTSRALRRPSSAA